MTLGEEGWRGGISRSWRGAAPTTAMASTTATTATTATTRATRAAATTTTTPRSSRRCFGSRGMFLFLLLFVCFCFCCCLFVLAGVENGGGTNLGSSQRPFSAAEPEPRSSSHPRSLLRSEPNLARSACLPYLGLEFVVTSRPRSPLALLLLYVFAAGRLRFRCCSPLALVHVFAAGLRFRCCSSRALPACTHDEHELRSRPLETIAPRASYGAERMLTILRLWPREQCTPNARTRTRTGRSAVARARVRARARSTHSRGGPLVGGRRGRATRA